MGGAHSGNKQSRAAKSERPSCMGLRVSLSWYGRTPPLCLAPRSPSLSADPTAGAFRPTQLLHSLRPQPRSTPAMADVSSASKFCKKLNLLCTELWVVLGSGLASPSVQTQTSTQSGAGFAAAPWGLGLCRGDRPRVSPSLGLEPSQHRGGKKQRHSGADWEGNPLPFSGLPQRIQLAVHRCEGLSASLPRSEASRGLGGGVCMC